MFKAIEKLIGDILVYFLSAEGAWMIAIILIILFSAGSGSSGGSGAEYIDSAPTRW
jgi:hypothetical protein